ncbi:hypothetical protein ACHAXR_012228 [Thalassiosira sp. AJA248-18]
MSIANTDADASSGQASQVANDIDIHELLSTCIDACRRGCEVIRNVRHKSLQSTDVLDSVQYKILDDPRSALTEADGASQKVIIECFNCCWKKEIDSGRIKIVGEEEEDNYSTDLEGDKSFDTAYSEDIMNHFDNYNSPRPDLEPIIRDMFGAIADREDTTENNSARVLTSKGDEIIIFIDPMDGTREFVEGRIQNVQCLIGITLNGVPVAGAMGLPMVHGDQIEIAYGMISPKRNDESDVASVPLLSGVKFFDAMNPLDIHSVKDDDANTSDNADSDDDSTLMVFSGDSKKPALKLAMNCLENKVLGPIEPGIIQEAETTNEGGIVHRPPIRKIVAGGCGNKILSVQRHFQCLSERQEEKYSSAAGCCLTDLLPVSASPPTVGSISVAPPGSSSWDTAAPTAVLLAADPSARITDLLGRSLVYDGENLLNNCGVVVSSGCVASSIHERLCKTLCQNEEFCEAIGVSYPVGDSAKAR